jgi:hypothetical protein
MVPPKQRAHQGGAPDKPTKERISQMQATKWFVAVIAAAVLCGSVRSASAALETNQAFQVDVKLKVSYEDPYTGKLGKMNITTSSIINLAMGLNVNIPVPPNVVLALVLSCDDSEGFVAVVDTDADNAILAVVGAAVADGSVDSKGKGVASMLIKDLYSGDDDNGLYGGWLAIGGSVQMDDPETNVCPLKEFKSKTLSGIIQGLDTVAAGGPFKVTVTGGSLKTIKSIGSVPPPPVM